MLTLLCSKHNAHSKHSRRTSQNLFSFHKPYFDCGPNQVNGARQRLNQMLNELRSFTSTDTEYQLEMKLREASTQRCLNSNRLKNENKFEIALTEPEITSGFGHRIIITKTRLCWEHTSTTYIISSLLTQKKKHWNGDVCRVGPHSELICYERGEIVDKTFLGQALAHKTI